MAPRVYLDAAAGAPLLPEARRAILDALDRFGDPLAPHEEGRAARDLLDRARADVARGIGALPDELVFTSGAAASASIAFRGAVPPGRRHGARVLVGAIEHPAVLDAAASLADEGVEVVRIPVDRDGRLDLDRFAVEVRTPRTVLASVQHANHELGTLQPLAEAARLAREAGVPLHADATHTVGHLPVDVAVLGVDLLTWSAHTFGGPRGVGALVVRRGGGHPGVAIRRASRRAADDHLPGIAGMAAALSASLATLADRAAAAWAITAALRDRLAAVPGVTVHGHPTQRVPHLVCFSVEGLDPATLAMTLDDRGASIGSGSPATGRADDPSPVLDAIGYPGTTSFRIGLTPGTSPRDVDRFTHVLADAVGNLRRMHAIASRPVGRAGPDPAAR